MNPSRAATVRMNGGSVDSKRIEFEFCPRLSPGFLYREESQVEYLTHLLDEMECDRILLREDRLRDLVEIESVPFRKEYGLDARPVCCQDFLFHSPDWQDCSAQCDLARHGEIIADQPSRQE